MIHVWQGGYIVAFLWLCSILSSQVTDSDTGFASAAGAVLRS